MLSYSNDWYQNFTLKYMSFKITFSGLLPNGRIFTTTEKYINTRKLTFVPLMLAIRDRWKPSCWENMIEIQRECLKLAVPGNFPVILPCRAFPWIFWHFLSIGKAGRERSQRSLLVRTISYGPYGWRHMGGDHVVDFIMSKIGHRHDVSIPYDLMKNICNRSFTSQTCRQYKLSPTSLTNIDRTCMFLIF